MTHDQRIFVLSSDCKGCKSKKEVCVHYPPEEVCEPGSHHENDKSYCITEKDRVLKCMNPKKIVLAHKKEAHYLFKPLHLLKKERTVSIYGEGHVYADVEPHFLSESHHVTYLYVQHITIKNRPINMLSQSLNTLGLEKCGLTELPHNIEKFENLEYMTVTSNHLTELRELPPNLKDLDARDNDIEHVRTSLLKLEVLALESNKIMRFEGHWPKLEYLELTHNYIRGFDAYVPALKVFEIDESMKAYPEVKAIWDRINNKGAHIVPPTVEEHQPLLGGKPKPNFEAAAPINITSSEIHFSRHTSRQNYVVYFGVILILMVLAAIYIVRRWHRYGNRMLLPVDDPEPEPEENPSSDIKKKRIAKPDRPRGDAQIPCTRSSADDA